MLHVDLFYGKIKPKQLIEINNKPVIIVSIRNTVQKPIKETTRRKAPDIKRGDYLITVQDYFTNSIYSIYDRSIINYKSIGFLNKLKLKFKKVFSG